MGETSVKKKKLTLRLSDSVISAAKQYAADQDVSLSHLTESLYLDQLPEDLITSADQKSKAELMFLADKYSGILKGEEIDEKEEVTNYLLEKYYNE